MLERQGALADAIVSPATSPRTAHPLQVRDKNLSNGKDLTETEDEKNNVTSTQGVGLTGIARANQAAQSRGGSMLASSRVHLTEARQQRMSQSYNNDENIESASRDATSRPGQQRSQVGSAAQTRLPRLANQRSIMSLR